MENETFTFKKHSRLEESLAELNQRYKVVVHLVRITERRWAYLAGDTDVILPSERIRLKDGFGAIIYSEMPLGEEKIKDLRRDLERITKNLPPELKWSSAPSENPES